MRTVVAVLLIALASPLAAQTGGITGVVVSKVTGERLSYAIVSLDDNERSTFATDAGEFRFYQLTTGPHTISVKRLGFSPLELTVFVRDAIDSVRIALSPVAVTLTGFTVRAWPPCRNPGFPSDTAVVAIIQQIKLNAEQLRFLSAQYPFIYTVRATRTVRLRKTGLMTRQPTEIQLNESKTEREYKPGSVVYKRGRQHYFNIPTLIDVADPAFVNVHCWHFGGTETIEDESVYRVDVVAADSLPTADVNGSFYVSTTSFQIRRSILHLSKRPEGVKEVMAMETTTDFYEVLPSIPIIERVYNTQTIDPNMKADISESTEEQRTTSFRFVGRKPGDDYKPRIPPP